MNSATEPTREECIEWLKKVLDPRFVGHRQYAAILNLLRPAAREGGLREPDNFNDEFFQLRNALRNWPKLPPAYVLKWLDGKFSEDWPRGKAMQRELGLSVIPPKTECEEGAGMWDRITEGKWRAALAPPAQAPSAKGVDEVASELRELMGFLCGESAMVGLHFGETNPAIRGNFWWRRFVKHRIERALFALSAPSFTEEEREALEAGARLCDNVPSTRHGEYAATLSNLATKGRL